MKTNFASPFSRRGFLRSMVGGSLLYPGLLSQLLAEDAARSGSSDPLLARARACENHVYLVSSTFTPAENDWMISAVFDRAGTPIAKALQWGTVAVAEVDLAQPFVGPYNLGDFRAMVQRHRP